MENRIAIVTGSVQGIGKAIALRFAEEKYMVAIHVRNQERYEEGCKLVEQCSILSGKKSICVVGDISEKAVCSEIIETVKNELGIPGILINCAGVVKYAPIEKFSEEKYRYVISNNQDSSYFMIQAVAPLMKKARFGRIINVSSLTTRTGGRGMSAYTASKAAIEAVTKCASLELAPFGITTNCILPGYIYTDWLSQLTEQQQKEELRKIPVGRFGEPRDVANLALFLASEDASYISGQSIEIAGGM